MFCQQKNHLVVQFIINEKPIYIYVVRGDVNDLLMYLKWDGKNFNERLIIIYGITAIFAATYSEFEEVKNKGNY